MVVRNEKFVDDRIVHIEEDIQKIQTSPQMFIGRSGSKGALHLGKEGFNNAIDECINPNSPGDEINIYLDESENELIVSDNGRGIPFEKMLIVCTTIQSSGKFGREGVGGTAGQNGVGLTVENALSERFEIISYRYGEKASIKFLNGKLIQDVTISKDKSGKHGTTVKFKPSVQFLTEDCIIKAEDISNWLEDIICLCPNTLTINFSVNRKGKESVISKKFKNKDGLYTMCKKFAEKPILDPIHFMKDRKVTELVNVRNEETSEFEAKTVQRFLGLEVAFTYNSSHSTDISVKSFCNFVTTVDDGEHVDGVKQGIIGYLGKHTRESLSEKDAKKIDIIPADITGGLVVCLFVSTDLTPEFGGQTKEKLNNPAFFRPLREMTFSALDELFRKNPKELKRFTDYIKTNAKARIESAKVRNSVVRGETSNMDEHKIKFFAPANNKGKYDHRELLIVEGESAFGTAKQGRFSADFQAIFGVRGYGLNTYGISIDKILDNKELRDLIIILKTNIGIKFDISKLNYKKIIIMTDSDADGFFIFSLLCAFFMFHMPEIVKQGFLYKAVAPLYKVNDKKKKYALNKAEYIEVFEERIGDNIRLIDPLTKVVMSNKDFRNFLMINREYIEELYRVASHYAIHPSIMEFVAIHHADINFKKNIKKRFTEIEIDDDNILSGVYEGKYQILNLDALLFRRLQTIKGLIFEDNKGKIYYDLHEKSSGNYVVRGITTIGGIMGLCQKYRPTITTRYKGLGELNYDQLRDTTLDPNTRLLIQLTMGDLKEELKKFEVLHGKGTAIGEERKELLSSVKIKREDIDN